MKITNRASLRKDMKKHLDSIAEDNEPLLVTSTGESNQNMVVISQSQYKQMIEGINNAVQKTSRAREEGREA